MCIGIPMQVTEVEDDLFAWCDGRNGRRRINTMLIDAVQPGDWLLTFLDSAREAIDAERAIMINSALDGLERVAAGQDNFEECFADLINREPQLPDFLRPASIQKEKV
jgi:hydrogenase assembly chaperone HypC/HupF